MTFCVAGGNLTTRFRRLAFKSIVWQVSTHVALTLFLFVYFSAYFIFFIVHGIHYID